MVDYVEQAKKRDGDLWDGYESGHNLFDREIGLSDSFYFVLGYQFGKLNSKLNKTRLGKIPLGKEELKVFYSEKIAELKEKYKKYFMHLTSDFADHINCQRGLHEIVNNFRLNRRNI
jgi:hypothetical protein